MDRFLENVSKYHSWVSLIWLYQSLLSRKFSLVIIYMLNIKEKTSYSVFHDHVPEQRATARQQQIAVFVFTAELVKDEPGYLVLTASH